jgi:hypothetical protein
MMHTRLILLTTKKLLALLTLHRLPTLLAKPTLPICLAFLALLTLPTLSHSAALFLMLCVLLYVCMRAFNLECYHSSKLSPARESYKPLCPSAH